MSELREVPAICLNAIISKTLNIFLNFCCIFQSAYDLENFGKEDQLYSFNISEVIDIIEMWLLECLKAPVLEQLSRINALMGEKDR